MCRKPAITFKLFYLAHAKRESKNMTAKKGKTTKKVTAGHKIPFNSTTSHLTLFLRPMNERVESQYQFPI